MSLRIERVIFGLDRTVKISLEGRLDANTSPEFETELRNILAEQASFLVLDLRGLSYISSAGIRAVMFAQDEITKKSGKVLITNLQPQIAEVMETVKMLPGLHVLGSDDEADQYLAKLQDDALKKKRGFSI